MTPAQRHRQQQQEAATEAAERATQEQAQARQAAAEIKPHAPSVFESEDSPPPSGYVSPAKRHRMAVAAGALIAAAQVSDTASAPPMPENDPNATEYQLLRAQLGEHMRQLKDIASIEDKIRAKRQMVDTYDAHVLGVLEASAETGKAVQDEIFVRLMMWRFDIGDFAMALEMAAHVLKFGLSMPVDFNRNAATYIGDAVSDAALLAQKLDQPFNYVFIKRAIDLIDGHNVNDIVRAKLERTIGIEFVRMSEAMDADTDGPAGAKRAAEAQALAHLQRAYTLHTASGVKKEMDRIAAIVAKHPKTEASA